ncbi:MAG: hypothetical protein HGA31_00160 [Candidatus Moranbacteria bacterium]|nr:hypothetical protein [Candidatus Moranbacteria bacterium]
MEIFATLPPPHLEHALGIIAANGTLTAARFNVGARSPLDPKETLRRLLAVMGGKPLYVDLKGRQLRIVSWAVPTFGDIVLNHEIEVDIPAEISFRGSQQGTFIRSVSGNRVYVDPPPLQAVGAGQSVNIRGRNLRIAGYLTDEDRAYVLAAKELGIRNYMLSFVEEENDLRELLELDPQARIIAKIESSKGLSFVKNEYPKYGGHVRLMAARDDLFENIRDDTFAMFDALRSIVEADPTAIAASRLLESFGTSRKVSLADLADLLMLGEMGYRNFMLSDEMSFGSTRRTDAFQDAMGILETFRETIENREE